AGGGGGTLIGRMKSGRGGSGGGANSGSIAASIKSWGFSLVGVHASLRLARAGFSAGSGFGGRSSAPPSPRQEADSSCSSSSGSLSSDLPQSRSGPAPADTNEGSSSAGAGVSSKLPKARGLPDDSMLRDSGLGGMSSINGSASGRANSVVG